MNHAVFCVTPTCFASCTDDLPDGTVLYSHDDTDLYVYQPDGSSLPAGKPAISNITANADGSFTLVGTLLNGIGPAAVWSTILPSPVVVNGQNVVTNQISGAQEFFRLSQ